MQLKDACARWLEQFNHVPGSIFRKLAQTDPDLYNYDSDQLRLLASPLVVCSGCDAVYEGKKSLQELREAGIGCNSCQYNTDGKGWGPGYPQYAFPCGWDTLFSPRDWIDWEWFKKHAEETARLGFFVFESEDFDLLLGIDAGGFDFYQAYWIPLYKLRGLKWHDEE